jgi:hypothetical protein
MSERSDVFPGCSSRTGSQRDPRRPTERATQNRGAELFRAELGYSHPGDLSDRIKSNIETRFLSAWLGNPGYTSMQITLAINRVGVETDNAGRPLYGINQAVYTCWAMVFPYPR